MARLRAKTGCLTCRRRRVKCGEERPSCCQCGKSKRQCVWPEAADLEDRRYRKHRSPSRPLSATSDDDVNVDVELRSCSDVRSSAVSETSRRRISLPRALNMPITGSEVEAGLIRHYVEHLVPVLLLPSINGEFHGDCKSQTLSMMLEFESVRYSVLACSASSKFMLGEGSIYRDMSLQFYAEAIRKVNQSMSCLELTETTPPDDVLVTVVYLYTNGLWGLDTFEDALKHVNGAMELLRLRSTDAFTGSSIRPFDRIMIESVFYQAFLLAVRYPFQPKSFIDTSLLIHTERLLASLISEGTWTTDNSPVLGAPLRLYRLILAIVSYTRSPKRLQPAVLAQMKASLKDWEDFWLHCSSADADISGASDPTAIRLLILAASLLLDWIAESSDSSSSIVAGCIGEAELTFASVSVSLLRDNPPCGRWQVQQALDILRRPGTSETCTGCYLGSWPVLIIGYAVTSEKDIGLVRQTLRRMQQRIGYGETQRMLDDLESVWSKR